MRKKMRFFRRLMPLMLLGIISSTAFAGSTADVGDVSINVEPGVTRVVAMMPTAVNVPTVPKPPLPITGVPKVGKITPQLAQMSCPADAPSSAKTSATTSASTSATTCGGGGSPPPEITYWWKGDFWVGSRAGTWYSFAQEFEWHVYGGKITKVTLNMCYRTGGAFYYYGCGRPNGPYDGTPRIAQSTATSRRVLAEWKFCAHPPTDGCQWPHTDITFGADGSIVGTVWYQ